MSQGHRGKMSHISRRFRIEKSYWLITSWLLVLCQASYMHCAVKGWSWTARRSNQSILKDGNSEYSLEGLILMLKLQYFSHLTWRASSLEKALILGKIEGRRRKEWQRMRWLYGITDSADMNLSKLWGVWDAEGQRSLGCCSPWGH